jgi:phosphoribosyl-ATP pyrophosphohydrolase/phosphoribosyl-AMP cyclohydrolase
MSKVSRDPVSLDEIDFAKGNGLVPAVVQDARTGEVLMLAWQNREALAETIATGDATFWSRSRNELWRKGATSGHTQKVESIAVDCDADSVLMQVQPAGPACHTGEDTCFYRPLEGFKNTSSGSIDGLLALERTLEERRINPPEGSYVAKLFADEDKRHKKVGEEATELVIASLKGQREAIVFESADLLFHMMVLLQSHGIGLHEVSAELEKRIGAPRRE